MFGDRHSSVRRLIDASTHSQLDEYFHHANLYPSQGPMHFPDRLFPVHSLSNAIGEGVQFDAALDTEAVAPPRLLRGTVRIIGGPVHTADSAHRSMELQQLEYFQVILREHTSTLYVA